MLTSLPKEPLGNSFEANWMRRLVQCLRERTPKGGRNHRIISDSDGYSLEQISGGGGGLNLKAFVFKSMETDYLVCRSWDGTDEGDSDIKVAKPPNLRFSVDSETLRGELITYSNYSLTGQSRSATNGTDTEQQFITRPYEVDDVLWAFPTKSFVIVDVGEAEINLLDANIDARSWTVPDQGA